MISAPIPKDELLRLQELKRYSILDTLPEDCFNKITQLASSICGTKISLISLVDTKRQWFKSAVGLSATETPRDISFCGHAIMDDAPFIIEDAELDKRFCDNPLFLNEPHVRFYAGIPLVTPKGFRIGTLCVIDSEKKSLSELQITMLKSLASQVIDILELRVKNNELSSMDQFFDLSLNFLCIADKSGKFVRLSKSWAYLGYDEEVLLSRPFLDFVHPEDIESTKMEMTKLSEGYSTTNFENRYRKKDGSYIYLRWSSSCNSQNGNIYAVAIDITENKKNEIITSEISELRARYIDYSSDRKKFFNFLLDKLLILTNSEYGFIGEILEDEKGKYLKSYAITDISWNDETRKFYKEGAPKGLVFRNLNTLFGEVIKSGKLLITNDAPHHPKAGGIPPGHPALEKFFGLPIYSKNKFIAMVGLANRKEGYSEELFYELKPYIDLMGEMLSAMMIEVELEHQKSLAMHNSRLAMIGQLAAGVGHEINNPLQIIMGHLSLARSYVNKDNFSKEDLQLRFEKIDSALNRISNIVKGLRTFARSDDSQISSFNMCELVKETYDLVFDIYRKEEVYLTYDCPKRNELISGNRGRIQQVIMNLLANAKDATEGLSERKIQLSIVPDGEFIKLRVSDNGKGIPEELREKIFDPFFTTKDVNKGTGIGLSLVSTIIREHGGKLDFESTPNVGTHFYVSLPFLR